MRSARMLAVCGFLAGCTMSTSSQPPEPEPATEGPGKPIAGAETEPGSEPEPSPKGPGSLTASDGGETEPPGDGGDGSDAPGPGDDGPETKTTLEPAEPPPATKTEPEAKTKIATTLELPRPLHAKTDPKCGKDPGVGESLKSFSLPTPDGKTITNGTYRGRVLVVNFWGTWCKPCLKELPEFDQIYRRYRKHGMTLLAIATDEEGEGVTDFANKRKLASKLAIGGEDYAGKYGSPKFPFTFVVDHKGVIRAAYRGYKPECTGQLEADIREQLQIRADAKAKRKQAKKKG